MVNQHKLELYFFFVILIGILLLSGMIAAPYLYSVALAIVFAIIFNPLFKKVSLWLGDRKALASLVTLLIVLITVLIPFSLIGAQILKEARDVYAYLLSGNNGTSSDFHLIENGINTWLSQNLNIHSNPINIPLDLNSYLKSGLSWLFQNVGSLVSRVASIALSIIIFLFALYYLLKDGDKLRKSLISLSPLADKYDEEISSKLEMAVNSIVKGSLVVSIIQGTMTGFGFFIFGIHNAAFWGAAASLAAFVPGVGTALIIVPGVIYLITSGSILAGIGLLLWGMLAVGLIDNFIGPKLVSRGVKIHSFFIMLFALGGLSFFGPIGFLFGPIILSLLFALIDVYKIMGREDVTR